MLDDALAHFERQIQPGKTRVALLEILDDAQRVQVVVEALAESPHFAVERLFARVREWRMPDIVRQRQRFREVFVELQDVGHGARHLRHFNGVRQPVAEVVGKARRENLRLGFQTPESARMNYAVAIALKTISVRMFRFRIPPSPALIGREPQSRKHRPLVLHFAEHGDRHLASRRGFDAQRLQQFLRLGRVLDRRVMLGQRDGGLIRGNENRGVRHQIAQNGFTLWVAPVGKIDLRQSDSLASEA